MRKRLLSFTFSFCVTALWGAEAQKRDDFNVSAPSEYVYVKESTLVDRDFPLFSMILKDTSVRASLAHDPALQASTVERWKAIQEANHRCKGDIPCKSRSLQFTQQQIEDVSAALRRLYESNASIRNFAHSKLKPVALFSLDASQSDEPVVIDTWVRAANDMNRIISTYCNGTAPRYAEIDSMTYKPDSKSYAALVTILLDDLTVEETSLTGAPQSSLDALFFEPTLRFSIRLLQSNSRDEAGRLWPLQTGANGDSVGQIASTDWQRFPYSAIVIPGAGSEVANVSISPWGRERVRLGVLAYRAGKAPVILVSGGFVHPAQTQYCEALEMRRYLIEVYGIPATAILLDPYARHTTTNLRNASREVFDYGIPINKPMLIVSDEAQITYISSAAFIERSRKELGYLPVAIGRRLSPSELEATPLDKSLYVDAEDPLDP